MKAIHYDNGTHFCEVQDKLGARGLVTTDEEAVTCDACLERFARIEWFRTKVCGRIDARRVVARVDWFGEGAESTSS